MDSGGLRAVGWRRLPFAWRFRDQQLPDWAPTQGRDEVRQGNGEPPLVVEPLDQRRRPLREDGLHAVVPLLQRSLKGDGTSRGPVFEGRLEIEGWAAKVALDLERGLGTAPYCGAGTRWARPYPMRPRDFAGFGQDLRPIRRWGGYCPCHSLQGLRVLPHVLDGLVCLGLGVPPQEVPRKGHGTIQLVADIPRRRLRWERMDAPMVHEGPWNLSCGDVKGKRGRPSHWAVGEPSAEALAPCTS